MKKGDKVIILSTSDDFKFVIGKEGTVMNSDVPDKIKVSFDENWCGYFLPEQLEIKNVKHIRRQLMNKIIQNAVRKGILMCFNDNDCNHYEIEKNQEWQDKLLNEFWSYENER